MLLDRFDSLMEFLATNSSQHARGTPLYRFADEVLKEAFREALPNFEAGKPVRLAEFGDLILPYERMGAIDSVDLFGLDELLMFAFYYRNKERYKRAADIGANLGLHSILLSKVDWNVEAYEPDPSHHAKLTRNLALNDVHSAVVHQAAVSDHVGTMQFVRVLGNTTSSHLAGAKANPYGELERFDVDVVDVKDIARRVDIMKIDAEGHEAVILNAIVLEQWRTLDSFVEIGSADNALAVFQRFDGTGVNIFAQKLGWQRVESAHDMPTSYKEGGVFISIKAEMPW